MTTSVATPALSRNIFDMSHDECVNVNGIGFSQVNLSHWDRVRAARREAGLPRLDTRLTNSPWIGKKFTTDSNASSWTVVEARKSWRAGFFIEVVLQEEGGAHSRQCLIAQNINSAVPFIENSAEFFHARFTEIQ